MFKLGGCLALSLALMLTTACDSGDDDKNPSDTTTDSDSPTDTDDPSETDTEPTATGSDTESSDTEDDPSDTEPSDTEDTGDDEPDSIYDIQTGVIAEGEWVNVKGVVTAVNDYGCVIQDPLGGEYSGIYVYQGTSWDTDTVERGDVVEAEGYVYEYGQTDFSGSLTEVDISSGELTVFDSGDELEPEEVDPDDLIDSEEAWESVLVQVVDVTAESSIDSDRRFTVEGVNVDDELYEYDNVYEGDTFVSIAGVYFFARGNSQILPRDADDIQGQSSEVTPIDDLDAGDLFVTEIMVNPSTCDDDDSEYIELYNATDGTIDVSGLEIADNSTRTATFDEVYLVEAESYVVVSKQTSNPCYDFQDETDLTFGFGLSNSGDELTLTSSTTTLDEVWFTGDLVEAGYALSVDPDYMDADANDDASAWCLAETLIEDSEDYGTPGEANDCTVSSGDTGGSDTASDTETGGSDTASDTDTGSSDTDSGDTGR